MASKPKEKKVVDKADDEVVKEANGFKKYKVVAKRLYVRNTNGNPDKVVNQNDVLEGQFKDGKIILADGNTVVAEFVEEVI